MRLSIAILALLAASRALADEPEAPYVAYAAQDEVFVRSGPGGNYYPVQTLKRGDPVKVVRHDPGGWCAIIPPAGSFNWIAADFIEPGQDNVAVVRGDRVAVRTGSVFGIERDVISARLYEGDEVLLLEPQSHDLGPRDQAWYKIAPLGEELRWIAGKFLVFTPAESEPQAETAPVEEPRRLTPKQTRRLAPEQPQKHDESIDLAAHEEAPRPTGWRKPTRRPLRELRTADARNRAVESRPPTSTGGKPSLSNVEAASLDELNVALAAIVADEVSQWDLAPLRRRAEELKGAARDSATRKQIRLLVRQIDRFDAIRERWLASSGGSPADNDEPAGDAPARGTSATRNAAPDSAEPNELAAGAPSPSTSLDGDIAESAPDDDASVQRVELERRYDGVGKLTEVVTQRSDTPRFALLDGKGAVQMYLTPAPGVNLRKHIGSRVGVEGRQGYLPDLKARHIAVRAVHSLE